jgi:lycopene cyclase domain-containing protein
MYWFYLIALTFSLIGCSILDWRYKLAFWYDRRRALITLGLGCAVFLLWDLLAIQQGIFIHGSGQYMLPFTLLPQFPLEEIFFIGLLCYSTLLLYRGAEKLWSRT